MKMKIPPNSWLRKQMLPLQLRDNILSFFIIMMMTLMGWKATASHGTS